MPARGPARMEGRTSLSPYSHNTYLNAGTAGTENEASLERVKRTRLTN